VGTDKSGSSVRRLAAVRDQINNQHSSKGKMTIKMLAYPAMLAGVLCAQAFAQSSPEALKKYVPVLDSVRAKFWNFDPQVGYGVKNVGGGVYVIADNAYQSAFLVTDAGVIVFDAPPDFAQHIPSEVAKVTDQPIRMLVYSHAHKDHIGGSSAFKDIKGLQIVALDSVGRFLKEKHDPGRLLPNVTFQSSKTITMGGKTVELTRHNFHSPEGDLFIYVPQARFLMAIDCVTAGYAPFQGFDLSTNFHEYLKMPDELLAYQFDTFVGGHLTDIGTRADVEMTKEFTLDVYNTVKRIHDSLDQKVVATEAAQAIGSADNKFLLFKVILDRITRDAVQELQPRWINRLAGVDVWLESHVRTALIYVRWDD
jgi:glyoxylase-like metal-dependent hydrolase (beta-lactamase superfamily II)